MTPVWCMQPGKPAPGNQSYIAASYIKFVEVSNPHPLKLDCAAAAQVVFSVSQMQLQPTRGLFYQWRLLEPSKSHMCHALLA